MIAFLSSHIGGSYKKDGRHYPALLNADNGLIDQLKSRWQNNARILIICSDPDSHARNDGILECLTYAFPASGLPTEEVTFCDSRNEEIIENLTNYHVIILAGGHVPTQNAYFRKIGLKERLKDFNGILIGISAGSMNSAEIVYAQPELDGETLDPSYQRFIPGLGLTKLMILPHYQDIKDDILDGQTFEEITYPDSIGWEFYALVDGSFVTVEKNRTILYGEAYLIKDGTTQQVCKKGESLRIN